MTEFTDKTGFPIGVTANFRKHMQAHKDTPSEGIQEVLEQVDVRNLPKEWNGNIVIDRKVSGTGVCALVYDPIPQDEPMLFAFRPGRDHPTRVSRKPGTKTQTIRVVVRPPEKTEDGRYVVQTAFWASTVQVGVEPISPSVNPNTSEGQLIREEAEKMWRTYALSLECIETEGAVFKSIWNKVFELYGYAYHPKMEIRDNPILPPTLVLKYSKSTFSKKLEYVITDLKAFSKQDQSVWENSFYQEKVTNREVYCFLVDNGLMPDWANLL